MPVVLVDYIYLVNYWPEKNLSYHFIRITQKITTQERSKYKAFRDYYQFMVVDNICIKWTNYRNSYRNIWKKKKGFPLFSLLLFLKE